MGNKESILNKKLNLGVVYLIIFLAGLIIVTAMISFINSKVQEFTVDYTVNDNY